MNLRFFLDNAWRRLAGYPEIEASTYSREPPTEKELLSRWNSSFIDLMRNRIKMGRLRYGPSTNKYNYGEGIKRKLNRYNETGNKEYLVDIANYAMLEFETPYKENTYFKPDDDGINHLPRLD